MAHTSNMSKNTMFRKIISSLVSMTFMASLITGPAGIAQAQYISNLPKPGEMVLMSPKFEAPALMGMTLHPENPLAFDFIVHRGQGKLAGDPLKTETTKLLKYFLAAMTMPEDDSWVNLSPYEGDRIIPDALAVTEMGKAMLEQDYLLKQLSASLTSPETDLGKKFWEKVYQKAYEKYGTTNVPISTFNKVWITPDSATILEQDGYVFIGESHLKVMLDEDYTSIKENLKNEKLGHQKMSEEQVADINAISSEVVRELIIPELEKEVNTGKNFIPVRQMYHSVILASWYKKNLKESLLGKIYVDKKKVNGVVADEKDSKQKVYDQYVEAFRKGVYNLIKEDYDLSSKETLPRKYFSGGLVWNNLQTRRADASSAIRISEQYQRGMQGGDLFDVSMAAVEGKQEGQAVQTAVGTKTGSSAVQWMRESGQVATYTIDTQNANKNQVYLAVGNVLLEVVPYRDDFTVQVIGLLDESNQLELLSIQDRPAVGTFTFNNGILIGRRGGEEGIYTPPLSDGSLSRRHFVLEVSAVSGKKNLKNIKITNLSTSNGIGRTQTLEDFRIKPRQRNVQEDTITTIIRTLREAVEGADAVGRYVTPGRINPDAVEGTFELTVDRVTGLSRLGGLQIQDGIPVRFDVLAKRTIKLSSQGAIPENILRAVEVYNQEIVHTTTYNAIPVKTNFDANNPYTAKLNGRELLAFVVSDPNSELSLTDLDMTVFRDPLTNTVMVNYQPTLLGEIAKESKTLTIGQSFGVDMGNGRTLFISNKSNSSISLGVVGQGQLTIIPKVSSSAMIGLAELTKIKPQILADAASRVPQFAWTFSEGEKGLLLGKAMSPEDRKQLIEEIRKNDRKRDIASRYLRAVVPYFFADGWRAELKKFINDIYGSITSEDPLSESSKDKLTKYLNDFLGAHPQAYQEILKFVNTTINPDLDSVKKAAGTVTHEKLTDLLLGDLRFFLIPEIFFKDFDDPRLKPITPIYEPKSKEEVVSAYRYLRESLSAIPESTRNDLLNSVRDSELLTEVERSAVLFGNDENVLRKVLDQGRKEKVVTEFLVELLTYSKPEEWEAVLRALWNDPHGELTTAQYFDTHLDNLGPRFLAQAGVGLVLRNPELVRSVAEESGLTGNALIRQVILRHPNLPNFMTPVTVASTPNNQTATTAENVGGIDFDPSLLNLQIKRNGKGVPLPLPQQNLEQINIDGLYPVILNIQPATIQNIPFLSSNTPTPAQSKNPQLSMLKR